MSSSPTESRADAAPRPGGSACPFEGGARDDKIHFPDVLDVLPLREKAAPRFGRRASTPRGGGDGAASDCVSASSSPWFPLALESLDVEERRARELADCTVDVLANTAPADIATPVPGLDATDGSDVDAETALAEEARCQRYFDEKLQSATLAPGGDPVLASPAWIEIPARDPATSSSAEATPEVATPRRRFGALDALEYTPTSPLLRPPSLTRHRPLGRGMDAVFAARASRLAAETEGAAPLAPESLRDVVEEDRRERADPNASHRSSFESVKNGLYELFCATDSKESESEEVPPEVLGMATGVATPIASPPRDGFAGISPIPNELDEEEEGEGAEAVRALAGRELFAPPVSSPRTPACVSPDPNASPPFAPRANKTRARTGEGVDEAESAALATSATRLDMDASAEEDANDFAEDAETAEAPAPGTPPAARGERNPIAAGVEEDGWAKKRRPCATCRCATCGSRFSRASESKWTQKEVDSEEDDSARAALDDSHDLMLDPRTVRAALLAEDGFSVASVRNKRSERRGRRKVDGDRPGTAKAAPRRSEALDSAEGAFGFAAILEARARNRMVELGSALRDDRFASARAPPSRGTSFLDDSAARRTHRASPSLDSSAFSTRRDTPLHDVLAKFSPAGPPAAAKGGKRLEFGVEGTAERFRDDDDVDPYAFTAEIRRILNAVR